MDKRAAKIVKFDGDLKNVLKELFRELRKIRKTMKGKLEQFSIITIEERDFYKIYHKKIIYEIKRIKVHLQDQEEKWKILKNIEKENRLNSPAFDEDNKENCEDTFKRISQEVGKKDNRNEIEPINKYEKYISLTLEENGGLMDKKNKGTSRSNQRNILENPIFNHLHTKGRLLIKSITIQYRESILNNNSIFLSIYKPNTLAGSLFHLVALHELSQHFHQLFNFPIGVEIDRLISRQAFISIR